MAKEFKIILFLILTFRVPLYSYSSEIIRGKEKVMEKVEFGEINWTDGLLTIQSTEKLPEIIKDKNSQLYQEDPEAYAFDLAQARKIARSRAMEKALQYLNNALLHLRLRNDFYIKDYLSCSNNNFQSRLSDLLNHHLKKEYLYNKDQTISARLFLRLYGSSGLITLFIDSFTPPLVPAFPFPSSEAWMESLRSSTNEIPQYFSSLVIDASGIKNLKPCLFPNIYDEENNLIYAVPLCLSSEMVKKGCVTYLSEITQIRHMDFIDDKSYILKALSVLDRTDLILPREMKGRFFSDKRTISSLERCNVIIILNP